MEIAAHHNKSVGMAGGEVIIGQKEQTSGDEVLSVSL